MGRVYRTLFSGVAVTAQQDLFELLAATGKPVKLVRLSLTQVSEVGDAQEEGLQIKVKRGVGATSGSGGSTHTPAPVDVNDTAAGATVEINNTTRMTAGGGSITQVDEFNWNVRVEKEKVYVPSDMDRIHPGDRLTIELATTPADSITMSGVATFEEV